MFNRIAGFGALGFAVILLGVNAMLEAGDPPAADAASSVVAAYFADNATAVRFGVVLAALNWVFISLFGAGAFVRIGRIERDRGEGWAAVGLVGIAMLNVMFSAVTAIRLALTTGDRATETLWHLHNAFFTVNNVALVVVLIGFSVGGLRTGTLRPWHGTLGLVSASLLAVGSVVSTFNAGGGTAGISMIGFVGWLLWIVWLGVFGVVLSRARQPVIV